MSGALSPVTYTMGTVLGMAIVVGWLEYGVGWSEGCGP